MTYPIPPDARATDTFDVVRGWETMDRRDFDFSDTIAGDLALGLGEPVKFKAGVAGVVKVDADGGAADYIVGTAAGVRPAGISWTEYNSDFENGGFPDALSTGKVTVLQGKFSCKFDNTSDAYFVAAGAFAGTNLEAAAVGRDVVAVYDHQAPVNPAAKYGCLRSAANRYAGPNPSAAEAAIDHCVIGKVSEISGNYVTVDFNV